MKTAGTKKTAKSVKKSKNGSVSKKHDHIPVIRKNAQMFSEGYGSNEVSKEQKIDGPVYRKLVAQVSVEVENKLRANPPSQKFDITALVKKAASDLKKLTAKAERRQKKIDAFEKKQAAIYQAAFERGRAILGLSKYQFVALVKGITAQQYIRREELYQRRKKKELASEERKQAAKKKAKVQ